MKKVWISLAIVVAMMALFVGTALAQGPNPNPGRNGTCTPTCTPSCTCTPQSGDQTQLRTRDQQRLMVNTPAAQGRYVRKGGK